MGVVELLREEAAQAAADDPETSRWPPPTTTRRGLDDSMEELQARQVAQSPTIDVDKSDPAESFELPGADLSDEELTVPVVPMLADEFRCERCFLVHHRSQLVVRPSGQKLRRDCV